MSTLGRVEFRLRTKNLDILSCQEEIHSHKFQSNQSPIANRQLLPQVNILFSRRIFRLGGFCSITRECSRRNLPTGTKRAGWRSEPRKSEGSETFYFYLRQRYDLIQLILVTIKVPGVNIDWWVEAQESRREWIFVASELSFLEPLKVFRVCYDRWASPRQWNRRTCIVNSDDAS
jgi:hypothetical protein